MKKIYVDGLGLVEGHFSGVGQYILGILKGMDELIEESRYAGKPTPRVVVIIPRGTVHKFHSFGFKNIDYKIFPLPFRYMAGLWHRGKLPPIDLWCGRGIYIFPRFVSMPLLFSKSVLVIYDLSFELHREFSDEGNARFLSKFVRKSLDKTQKVITISRNAQKETIDFYKIPVSKISIAYPATDPALFYRRSSKEIDKVKVKYDIKGDYILALSNLEPRKNLAALIHSYCELPKHLTDKYPLLLVGVSGWKTEALFKEILKKVDEGYNIIRPSAYVLDKDKPAIISGASLLVYPSHYEGFGIPPVEALACGVPVIAANNSSIPEAVGKAGQLIDVTKEGILTKTIEESLSNINEITSKTLVLGPEQAQAFSWKKSAQVFLDASRELNS
jgi:glycosyltransferase involved in cell wall biosynthesis